MKHLPSKPAFDVSTTLGKGKYLSRQAFNLWFETKIIPLFTNAVEVVGYIGPIDDQNSSPIVTKKGIFISEDTLGGRKTEDVFAEFVNIVDEALLLDEDLGQAWTELRIAVENARSHLLEQKK